MIFTKTNIGAYIIELEKREDERGFFARSYCAKEFRDHNLPTRFVQINISNSKKKGTFRGIHYQKHPYREDKLIKVTRGAIYDVIIDIRKNSSTFGKWFGVELTAENHKMIFVPKGFAHGHITLKDNTEIIYLASQFYTPNAEGGIRYNDPTFNIKLPLKVTNISKKDESWSNFFDNNK